MKTILHYRGFLTGLRWIVGAVFLYAGIIKMRDPQEFADSIASFALLRGPFVSLFALILPPFEILVSLLWLTGWQRRAGALAVLGMTTVFAVALLSALARGLQVDCGCFGSGHPSPLKTWFSLGRDVLLFAAALTVYRQGEADSNEVNAPG